MTNLLEVKDLKVSSLFLPERFRLSEVFHII